MNSLSYIYFCPFIGLHVLMQLRQVDRWVVSTGSYGVQQWRRNVVSRRSKSSEPCRHHSDAPYFPYALLPAAN